MKWVFPFLVAFLLLAPFADSLESNTVFSVQPGAGYKCVYVNLPQDLGIGTLNQGSETIIELNRNSSPWADTTYSKVIIGSGVRNKSPVCFHYSGREEGDFSFYDIKLSSLGLGISNSISGGLCVSNYTDVDTGVDAENGTDICKLLNDNADIIDLSFGEDTTQAKPGEVVSKTLYVTSYANLRIRLSIATNLQNDFGEPVVTTSPSKPMASKTFKIKAPDHEGDFEMMVMAQAEGCNIRACSKQKQGMLSVSQNGNKGFSVSVIPRNINLKEAGEVLFRVVISNHEDGSNFTIEADSDPPIDIYPAAKTINVDKDEEATALFKASAGSEKLYTLGFRITADSEEREESAYISVGELLGDALRYSEEVEKTASPDLKEEIAKARDEYEQKYNSTSYGDDLEDYENFQKTLDDAKMTTENNDNVEPTQKPADGGFNILFVVIPVIAAVAVMLFLVFRKAKAGSGNDGSQQSYPNIDGRY